MSRAHPGVAFFPRFTTLVGATSFTTTPIDVSRLDSARLQLWRGDLRGTAPTFALYLEESLDAENWVQGPGSSAAFDVSAAGQPKFLTYCFQLRWFRLRIELGGGSPMVSCWVEGLLR